MAMTHGPHFPMTKAQWIAWGVMLVGAYLNRPYFDSDAPPDAKRRRLRLTTAVLLVFILGFIWSTEYDGKSVLLALPFVSIVLYVGYRRVRFCGNCHAMEIDSQSLIKAPAFCSRCRSALP